MPLHQTISIHAPRVGSDGDNSDYIPYHLHFNPRSPCGERRPHAHTPGSVARNFNPRSPCGERQIIELLETKIILISIHAPRVGSDVINHRHQTSKI